MLKNYFTLLILGLFLTSCGGNAESRANELCDCFQEVGIDFDGISSERDLQRLGQKMDNLSKKKKKKAGECIIDVAEAMHEDVEDMDDEDIAGYLREFVKAGLDTECAIDAMEAQDFDKFADRFEEMIESMENELENELDRD